MVESVITGRAGHPSRMSFTTFKVLSEKTNKFGRINLCFEFSLSIPCVDGLNIAFVSDITARERVIPMDAAFEQVERDGAVVYTIRIADWSFPEDMPTYETANFSAIVVNGETKGGNFELLIPIHCSYDGKIAQLNVLSPI